jgi:hypothetical protein
MAVGEVVLALVAVALTALSAMSESLPRLLFSLRSRCFGEQVTNPEAAISVKHRRPKLECDTSLGGNACILQTWSAHITHG